MKLRKRLLFLSILIAAGFLVILIPALLSYSRDIRNELLISYGIPKEPQVLIEEPSTLWTTQSHSIDIPLKSYLVKSPQAYPYQQANFIVSKIHKMGVAGFLLKEMSNNNFYYCVAGPFLSEDDAILVMRKLYQQHLYEGMIVTQIPDLEKIEF